MFKIKIIQTSICLPAWGLRAYFLFHSSLNSCAADAAGGEDAVGFEAEAQEPIDVRGLGREQELETDEEDEGGPSSGAEEREREQ